MFSKQLLLHKECVGGSKTNFRGHVKTCLLMTLPPSIAMMGKGQVRKDRTANSSQKQTGSQGNDTVTQNEKTKKTKKNSPYELSGDLGS